jgi:hypothetical protein
MPALKPGRTIGWPKNANKLTMAGANKAISAGRVPVSPWEGVERALGARNYSKQTIGGCASRGKGSTPERDGPFEDAAKQVADMMPAHARQRAELSENRMLVAAAGGSVEEAAAFLLL